MPDFVGMLFWFASAASHDVPTETEKRLKPFLLLLAADFALHWVFSFKNPLESLLVSVMSVYTIYMFLGEVIKRIREEQPERALHLNFARTVTVLALTANFLLSAYDNSTLNGVIVISFLLVLVFLMVQVCLIRPKCGEKL